MTRERRNGERGAFASLVAAATAIEQRRPEELLAALGAVSPNVLLRVAARHRCLGYLRHGILELAVRDARAQAVTKPLREYASKAAIQAYAVRSQLQELVHRLNEAKIKFALLKGSARLFRGDKDADYDTMFDLDILVPREEAAFAVGALQRVGYQSSANAKRSAHYWSRHHHAAPMQSVQPGLPIEVHVQLAPPGSLSLATDWHACQAYFERIAMGEVAATCFTALGSAIHLTIHGLGIRRLHDVILLAKILRSDKDAYENVVRTISQEKWQTVALAAVATLAARIAGRNVIVAEAVQRYLAWVEHRENLMPYVRDRTQFADAWFCNGGTVWGPATRRALPLRESEENTVSFAASFAYRFIGRVATSAYALAWAPTAPTMRP